MRLTRRELAAALAPAALAAAQTATPTTPADDLQSAQAQLKAVGAALARREVPMDVEPAFQFKA